MTYLILLVRAFLSVLMVISLYNAFVTDTIDVSLQRPNVKQTVPAQGQSSYCSCFKYDLTKTPILQQLHPLQFKTNFR